MSGSITLSGSQELITTLLKLGGDVNQIAGAALKEEAETIMTDSKANYVPVQDGILRNSGYVGDPAIEPESVSVEIGYGGAASAYALVQHERLDFKHPHGKSAKYLEKPLMAAERGFAQRVAVKMRKGLENAVGSKSQE